MVSVTSRTPLYRVDADACCPRCGTGGRDIPSDEGVKIIRHGGNEMFYCECDTCGWSSRQYEYDGDSPTPVTMMHDDKVTVSLSENGELVLNNGYGLDEYEDYTLLG